MAVIFAQDERGAVAVDWVTLTGGILILGIVVVYSVLGNSAGYLMDEFDELNKQYERSSGDDRSSDIASSGPVLNFDR